MKIEIHQDAFGADVVKINGDRVSDVVATIILNAQQLVELAQESESHLDFGTCRVCRKPEYLVNLEQSLYHTCSERCDTKFEEYLNSSEPIPQD